MSGAQMVTALTCYFALRFAKIIIRNWDREHAQSPQVRTGDYVERYVVPTL